MTKFRHLPVAGRLIIVAVAIGVFAIAVVACATSYNAIYRLVGQLGLYGYRINQAFPLMLDAAFLVAELAAILGGIMRAVTRSDEVSAGWPGTTMLLCGLGTIGFNVAHAYLIGGRGDPLTIWRCVVASLPPVLMILSFQVLIAIVKWVMLHLGRPLNSAAALTPTAMPGYGLAPPPSPYGLFPPHPVYGQVPSWAPSQDGQNGHPAVNGGGGEQVEATKRHQVEAYLGQLDPAQLDRLGTLGPRAAAREVTGTLTGQGLAVSERYVQQILDDWTAARRGSGRAGRAAGDRAQATAGGGRPAPHGRPPARLGPGELLGALGELGCARAAPVYAALGFPVVPMHAAQPGEGCSCPDRACSDPGKHPRLAGWKRLAVDRPGGGGGVVAALAPGQPGPGHRSALRRARPGRQPWSGGAARRLVDRPHRAPGAGGPHRRGRMASAVRPHRARQPGQAPAGHGLARPGRADRGPTLPPRQRHPLHLGPAPDGDAARGPGRAAAAAGPTGGRADHPPPSPPPRPAAVAATGGRRWRGSGPRSRPPSPAAATRP